MHPTAEALIAEIRNEAQATRRVLERVPEGRLDWRPHPRSMSLGQLAQHVASLPGAISRMATLDSFDAATANFTPEPAASRAAALATHDASIEAACAFLAGLSAESAAAPWRLTLGEQEVFTLPRVGLIRTLACNHVYHHRGQLTVYLRLLDVPVPVVYGRSADEDPFAQMRAATARGGEVA
jgi:uncharacterized damage-inducible protein DinB